MIDLLKEIFRYGFMYKALIVGCLIALCCSLLGQFLVLKKLSMIGDGLAHVSFASVAVALLTQNSPLLLSIPVVALASVLILKLTSSAGINGDAAIALISSFSVALGITLATIGRGFNIDLYSYLFGSILILSDTDVVLSAALAVAVIILVTCLNHSLFAVTYDEDFARVCGINAKGLNYLIVVLTAVTIVIGIRMVGTMLISSLIIFPAVSALQLSAGFRSMTLLSGVISVLCVIAGLMFAYIFDLPAGAAIVLLNAFCFVVLFCANKIVVKR